MYLLTLLRLRRFVSQSWNKFPRNTTQHNKSTLSELFCHVMKMEIILLLAFFLKEKEKGKVEKYCIATAGNCNLKKNTLLLLNKIIFIPLNTVKLRLGARLG